LNIHAVLASRSWELSASPCLRPICRQAIAPAATAAPSGEALPDRSQPTRPADGPWGLMAAAVVEPWALEGPAPAALRQRNEPPANNAAPAWPEVWRQTRLPIQGNGRIVAIPTGAAGGAILAQLICQGLGLAEIQAPLCNWRRPTLASTT